MEEKQYFVIMKKGRAVSAGYHKKKPGSMTGSVLPEQQRLSRLYLAGCMANQTFMRVAEVGGQPAGVIMGKDCGAWKPSATGLLRQTAAALALLSGKEGRELPGFFRGLTRWTKNC